MPQRPSLPHMPCPQSLVSPPHNPHPRASPLKPRKSPPPPLLHRTRAVTSASPLRHAQVRCHHPVTARKTSRDTAPTPSQHGVHARLRRQPAPRKPRHGANPPHTSPATACKPHHDANPSRTSLAATPPHHDATQKPCHGANPPPLLTSYSSTS